jgi:hypothetical protein
MGERNLAQRVIEAYRVNSSAVAVALLVITNLIPLAGVLWLGWDLELILALYWVENGVVGVINVLKILSARGTNTTSTWRVNGRPASSMSRVGLAGFFCMHYGIFWIGHGGFVLAFVPAISGSVGGFGGQITLDPVAIPDAGVLAFAAIGLAISHGTSFWMNYLGHGEYLTLSPAQVMSQPYGRLVIMHLTIILGAFVSIFLGTPIGSLLVLVVLKTALDLYFHLRQHRDVAPAGEGPAN